MERRLRRVAEEAVEEWIKGRRMARVLRELLPRSGLTLEERERVAETVHRVVRYQVLYEYVLERMSYPKTPRNYIKLALGEIGFNEELVEEAPYHIRVSASEAVAEVLRRDERYLSHVNREAQTYLAVNLLRTSRVEVQRTLEEEGLQAEEFLPETALRTEPRGRYSIVVERGLAHVQDPSSQIISKVAARLGEDVLDYCAGNGGKSLTMAYFGATVFSYDRNRGKLRNLERRAELYSVPVKVEWWPKRHQVVLVDAPCSGLGAAARNPEVKYYRDLKGFPEKQLSILKEAEGRAGEYIIYSVCTFTKKETEEVSKRFLERFKIFECVDPGEILPKILTPKEMDYIDPLDYGAIIRASDVMYLSIFRKKR
ncbi:MAG: RsmB/NOP family class I SAM-dependent RNA methyltransferase [Thermoplasmata archaeon]|nr:RsmB/NOP family class I SAM-dependent RNA methyltransferase [Thermoplasmata archaeon]